MPSSEDWIEGPGALSFYSKAYTPTSTPRAHIVFAHGFMEHIQRYEHVFDRWMLHGYSIFAFDQRGFGKTGQKNDQQGITSWPKALADLDYFINREATSHPDVPLFLFGHSMGGALSIAYATRQPLPTGVSRLSGVIASAPLIDQVPKVKASSALVKAGSVLGRVLPSLQFSVGVPSNDISRDDAVNKAYAADPLCPPIGSYRGVSDMLLGGPKLIKDVSRWPPALPIHIYHGTGDKVTYFDATKKLFDNLPSTVTDKTFMPYEGYYHELHNEPGDDKWVPIDAVRDWIDARHTKA